ncbi:MAG: hypothetical protein HOO86_08500, partial [Bacteroidales bacterium]|nr:hypothetical protein [Bacteroidales bacterium]
FVGDVEKVLTTGSIADKAVFKINSIRIANRTTHNVELTVSHSLKSDFVFGQEILNECGEYSIDTKGKTLIFK